MSSLLTSPGFVIWIFLTRLWMPLFTFFRMYSSLVNFSLNEIRNDPMYSVTITKKKKKKMCHIILAITDLKWPCVTYKSDTYKTIIGWNDWIYIFRCCQVTCWFHDNVSACPYCLSQNSGVYGIHVASGLERLVLWTVSRVCLATVATLGLYSVTAMGPYILVRLHAWHCHMYILFLVLGRQKF